MPLSKRIKRHVIGRIREYFAVTSPGFEELCLNELMMLPLSVKEAGTVTGGVLFKGKMQDCYLANLYLRTATRILMRIEEFKATNFNQLEKRLADIPWELFLPLISVSEPLDIPVSVTSRHSRLYHKNAIAERFQTSIATRLTEIARRFSLENQKISDKLAETESDDAVSSIPRLFIRLADDRVTISLDTSGEPLYKRGLKQHIGEAPIRETIGSAILKLADYDGKSPLIDPMCGSGTFSLEGAMIAANIPPGWFRDFAFMRFPSFKPEQWQYLKQEAEKKFIQPDKPLIFASDQNKAVCDRLEESVKEFGLSEIINITYKDFFDFSPADVTDKTGLVVMNPPYGLRIGTPQESDELFFKLCSYLKKKYKGWKIAIIAPNKDIAAKVPFKVKSHIIHHGGLKLTLLIGRIYHK